MNRWTFGPVATHEPDREKNDGKEEKVWFELMATARSIGEIYSIPTTKAVVEIRHY